MKKINNNLFIKIQKKIALTVFFSLTAFALLIACDKPNPPNGGTTNPTDTMTHDISYWECVIEESTPYHNYHFIISLSIDHTINRLYSTVTHLRGNDPGIMWGDGNWADFIMDNDTMYYTKAYSQELDYINIYEDPFRTWIVTYPADTLMIMESDPEGPQPTVVRIESYLFNLKK